MTDLGTFEVSIITKIGLQKAFLSPATKKDIPKNWSFNWLRLWEVTNFEYQNIIKLIYDGQVWGLVRYSIFPHPLDFLEIEHLETNPINRGQLSERLVIPTGKWLIWYAVQVGFAYCSGIETLITLVSLEEAVNYYRDVIKMQDVGFTTIAPGEDGYAFKFSKEEAETFCNRQQNEFGVPTRLNP